MDSLRAVFEAREREILSPFAARAAESRGRDVPEEEHPYRTAYQRDRDRIVHTKAFRRLKRKTQVFLAPRGDHYRTRLTHTLEVAQISRTIARALFLNEDLTEAIALGHDLGHTPFGHAGEAVLNEVYIPGFTHAEQSLRVVELLERRKDSKGLNLTLEVRDGIRYHSEAKATLLHGATPKHPATLEGRVVAICDAIAYISHDIDDALRARVLDPAALPPRAIAVLGATTSERIDHMAGGVIAGSHDDTIGIVPDIRGAMNELRDFLYTNLYPCEAVETEIHRARYVLRQLYCHLLEHPLPEILEANPEDSLERRTVDFIAGMTDHYAVQLYAELMLPTP